MHKMSGLCQGPHSGSMTERLPVVASSVELFVVLVESLD